MKIRARGFIYVDELGSPVLATVTTKAESTMKLALAGMGYEASELNSYWKAKQEFNSLAPTGSYIAKCYVVTELNEKVS